jgi:hypothetical protein
MFRTDRLVPLILTVAGLAVAGATGVLAQQKNERPRLLLRALPNVAVAPARVVFTAELQGGSDDFEDYYCPSIEWDWDDGTRSESSTDCEPFEAGKTAIRRRYSVQHVFRRDGPYRCTFT